MIVNHATKTITAKIVYYGPGLSGKTTNLQGVHQSLAPARRGKLVSLATELDRTIFFDFLPLSLGSIRDMNVCVQFYTVPGQAMYNATRKIVLEGVDGIVFVADSSTHRMEANIESLRNLEENLESRGLSLKDLPHVLQFNKRDEPDLSSVEELEAALNSYGAPVLEAVAIEGIGVQSTLEQIVKLTVQGLTGKCFAPVMKRSLARVAGNTVNNENVPAGMAQWIVDKFSPGTQVQRSGRSAFSGICWFELDWSSQLFQLEVPAEIWEAGRWQWIGLRARLAAPAPETTRAGYRFWVSLYEHRGASDPFVFRFRIFRQSGEAPRIVAIRLSSMAAVDFANRGRSIGHDPQAHVLAGALAILKRRIDEGNLDSDQVVDHDEVVRLWNQPATESEILHYIERRLSQSKLVDRECSPLGFDLADLEYLGVSRDEFVAIESLRENLEGVVDGLPISFLRATFEGYDPEPAIRALDEQVTSTNMERVEEPLGQQTVASRWLRSSNL